MSAPSTSTSTTDDVVIPEVPEVLANAKRASARALFRSFNATREGLVECWQTIRAYRVGGKEIDDKLATSDEDAAIDYRDAEEQVDGERDSVTSRYEEAIKPFKDERDRQMAELDAKLKGYKDTAVSALGLDADIPSKEDAAEALTEWKSLTLSIRQLISNAKRQNIEIDYTIPNIAPRSGTAGTGTDAFRPRFSACTLDGKASGSLLAGDIAKEIGVTRNAFVGSLLSALDGNRDAWDKEDGGYELSFNVGPINADKDGNGGKTVAVNVVKADPISRKSKEESEDDAAADAEEAI